VGWLRHLSGSSTGCFLGEPQPRLHLCRALYGMAPFDRHHFCPLHTFRSPVWLVLGDAAPSENCVFRGYVEPALLDTHHTRFKRVPAGFSGPSSVDALSLIGLLTDLSWVAAHTLPCSARAARVGRRRGRGSGDRRPWQRLACPVRKVYSFRGARRGSRGMAVGAVVRFGRRSPLLPRTLHRRLRATLMPAV